MLRQTLFRLQDPASHEAELADTASVPDSAVPADAGAAARPVSRSESWLQATVARLRAFEQEWNREPGSEAGRNARATASQEAIQEVSQEVSQEAGARPVSHMGLDLASTPRARVAKPVRRWARQLAPLPAAVNEGRTRAPALARVIEANSAVFSAAASLERCVTLAFARADPAHAALKEVCGDAADILRLAQVQIMVPIGTQAAGWKTQREQFAPIMSLLERAITRVTAGLKTMAVPGGTSAAAAEALARDFAQATLDDLARMKLSVIVKARMLEQMFETDPLSSKWVASFEKILADAAALLLEKAARAMDKGPDVPQPHLARLRASVAQVRQRGLSRLQQERTPGERLEPQAAHKIFESLNADYRKLVATALREAGLNGSQVQQFSGGDAWRRAMTESLARRHWPTLRRGIVAAMGGPAQAYESSITPGARINYRFTHAYEKDAVLGKYRASGAVGEFGMPRGGVPSSDITNAVHARNLKVSQLFRLEHSKAPLCLSTVIGHGVIDAWGIADPLERAQANARAAREVLEAAIVSVPRIADALDERRYRSKPLRVTHVSVNLVTPDSLRGMSTGYKDYHEKTFTENQFKAFDEAAKMRSVGGDMPLQVEIRAITFSFAINPLATGPLGAIARPWANVLEHNAWGMYCFIGKLSAVQPGEFIGAVLQTLDRREPRQGMLYTKILRQTERVRTLFNSEAYKTANGDPAKMAREVLFLQALAEQALALTDGDHIATASRNCKSDKDRGGVVDVELKYRLITDDLGHTIEDNAAPQGAEREIYDRVALAAGGLEVQAWNTGLPGSKEFRKMKSRVADEAMRTLLTGFSASAVE